MKTCKTCRHCGLLDGENGYCHLNPPWPTSITSSTYTPVGPDKPGCSHHKGHGFWAAVSRWMSKERL